MRKNVLALACCLMSIFPLSAKIAFLNPQLNDKNELIFSVKHDITGSKSYSTLFVTKLQGENPEKCGESARLITYYPEQMELLSLMDSRVLQIRNRYGTARYYSSTDFMGWKEVKSGIPTLSCTAMPYSASSDGKWFCYVKKTDHSNGKLILESSSLGRQVEIGEKVLLDYSKVPVKWSPDGSILLYEKDGDVYFCRPEAVFRDVEVEEKYRRIGRGSINSVEWASQRHLVYIDDCMVYRINSRELYTLGLYSGIIGQGTPIGRLPFQFNEIHDSFSVNSLAKDLVVSQNSKNFTYFKTLSSSCDYMEIVAAFPYTDSSASLVDYSVFWGSDGLPVLWQSKMPYSSAQTEGVFLRLGPKMEEIERVKECGKPVVSPEGTKVFFSSEENLFVYSLAGWKQIGCLSGEKIVSALWEDDSDIYAGGEKTIRHWDTSAGESRLIALSTADEAFWDTKDRIVSFSGNGEDSGEFYYYSRLAGIWETNENSETDELLNTAQNGAYRVYCGTTPNKIYSNALYVRTLAANPTTKAVFSESIERTPAKRKVALVFDAYDNADGLSKIISALRRFNVPGTFFLNGEFIRRYPNQTRQITINGFECASMFFTTSDLTERTFLIDADFIRRGLGRNEDEFLACTGKELSLFWHAPFYMATDEIISAGKASGYTYVPSIHLHTDTVTISQIEEGKTYVKPEILISEYVDMVELTGGGMVPVTVGLSRSALPDNLWENIELLINALLDAGFDLVTMSDL